jgi:ribonuclease HII
MSDYIIGSDEVGTGAWAGPFFVCAVAVLKLWKGPEGLTDSKDLTPTQRVALYQHLHALPLSIMSVESTMIDSHGLRPTLVDAHTGAIQALLARFPDADVVVDGVMQLPLLPRARCVPKADALFPAVSAASVIAKVNRDFVMQGYATQYPGYGFGTNVGYRSALHEQGLARLGPCPIHRRSYAPIKKLLEKT